MKEIRVFECSTCHNRFDEREAAQACEYSHLTTPQAMATALHDAFCHWNHTDGCGWLYESWLNPGHARRRYLEYAKQWLDFLDRHSDVTLPELIGLLKALR